MDNRQGMVLHLWGFGEGLTTPQSKKTAITKCYVGPRTWLYPREHGNVGFQKKKKGGEFLD